MGDLKGLGWGPFFERSARNPANLAPARVSAVWGESYTVISAVGPVTAVARGALPLSASPTVGDWVMVALDASDGWAVIETVLRRRSALVRRAAGARTRVQVLAANVDVVFIVQGLDRDFNLRRLERTITATWECGAEPVVLLNKLDLLEDPRALDAAKRVAPGVMVRPLCAIDGRGVEVLATTLAPNRTGVLVGSSGAGKSTLINRLLGGEVQRTASVRVGDSRGRHTTSARRLFPLPDGGALIDGPGVRELQLWEACSGLRTAFEDIDELAGRCRFRDCRHAGEPGCAVAAAVAAGELAADRLASLHKLQREAAFVARQRDVLVRIEETRRWKAIHKSLRRMPKKR